MWICTYTLYIDTECRRTGVQVKKDKGIFVFQVSSASCVWCYVRQPNICVSTPVTLAIIPYYASTFVYLALDWNLKYSNWHRNAKWRSKKLLLLLLRINQRQIVNTYTPSNLYPEKWIAELFVNHSIYCLVERVLRSFYLSTFLRDYKLYVQSKSTHNTRSYSSLYAL